MVYLTGNTVMQAKARGGFMKSIARSLAVENVFLTEFTTTGGPGIVAVAGPVPDSIIAKEIVPARAIFAQKGAFLITGVSIFYLAKKTEYQGPEASYDLDMVKEPPKGNI